MNSDLSDSGTSQNASLSYGKVYCICKSTDIDRFMIGCDKCNEWYHGDCIGITQIAANHIKSYYCESCRDINPSLQIKYKEKLQSLYDVNKHKHKKKKKKKQRNEDNLKNNDDSESIPEYGNKINNKNQENYDDFDDFTDDNDNDDDDDDFKYNDDHYYNNIKRKVVIDDGNFKRRGGTSSQPIRSSGRGRGRGKGKPKKDSTMKVRHYKKRGNGKLKRDQNVKQMKTKKIIDDLNDEDDDDEDYFKAVQCYGPGCIKQARINSKYCCDECGINLATLRLKTLLPDRTAAWTIRPSTAAEHTEIELNQIEREIIKMKQELVDLEKQHETLNSLIDQADCLSCISDDEEMDEGNETTFPCLICAQDITAKLAMRHWERCYQKAESQMSFASIYQTRIEGRPLFCDYYNERTGTYCKRLKVICPEHTKELRIHPKEVCGAPLQANLLSDSNELCRVSKKSCLKHFCWEKNRRAHIDVQRLRAWWVLDELFERRRILELNNVNRGSVINILLNKTVDHQPQESLPKSKCVPKPVLYIP